MHLLSLRVCGLLRNLLRRGFVCDGRRHLVVGCIFRSICSFSLELKLRSLPYLPLCVLLQDVGLREMADRIPESDLDAYHAAAAAQILTGQSLEAASLREAGIMLIDTPPDLLTERLINEYLSIKARNLM